MESPVLKADALVRDFAGGPRAVDGLSFSLRPGEVLGFLGPNGAGKSTTMQMITGSLAPSSGSVQLAGFDLLRQPVEAKRRIGYLPEIPPLHMDLRVQEFLYYAARLRGLGARQARLAVPDVIDRCGLARVARRLINQLSKGYRQRVGLAQAIVHGPEVVILDEPTVGLDPVQIRSVRELIRDLGREHGVILSTHLLAEVQTVCDRVLIINRGRLVYQSSLAEAAGADEMELRCRDLPTDAIDRLQGLAGIIAVSHRDGGLRLQHDGRVTLADDVAALVREQGWQLISLAPLPPDLEQVFVDLSLHDGPESQGSVAR